MTATKAEIKIQCNGSAAVRNDELMYARLVGASRSSVTFQLLRALQVRSGSGAYEVVDTGLCLELMMRCG